MTTKYASEFFEVGAAGLPVVATPVNEVPSNGAVAGSQTPILKSKGYVSLYNQPQESAQFIVYDATGAIVIQDSGVLPATDGIPVEQWEVPTPLALSTTYMWQHRFKSTKGEDYIDSVKTSFIMPSSSAGIPDIVSPVEGQEVDLQAVVEGTPFEYLGASQTHTETNVRVATDVGFTNVVGSFNKNSGDLTKVDVTFDNSSTEYFIQMQYSGNLTAYSDWSIPRSITTLQNTVVAPTITSPYHGEVSVQGSARMTSSAFQYEGQPQAHVAAEWELYTDAAMTQLVFSTGLSSSKLTTINIDILVEDTSYFLRKRDQGSITGLSEWSTLNQFTMAQVYSDWSNWNGTNDGIPLNTGDASTANIGSTEITVTEHALGGAPVNFCREIANRFSFIDTYGLEVSSQEYQAGGITIYGKKIYSLNGKIFCVGGSVSNKETSQNIRYQIISKDGSGATYVTNSSFKVGVASICSVQVSNTEVLIMYKTHNTTSALYTVYDVDLGVVVEDQAMDTLDSTVRTVFDGYTQISPDRTTVVMDRLYSAFFYKYNPTTHSLTLEHEEDLTSSNNPIRAHWLEDNKLLLTYTTTYRIASYVNGVYTESSRYENGLNTAGTEIAGGGMIPLNSSEYLFFTNTMDKFQVFRFVGDFLYPSDIISKGLSTDKIYNLELLGPNRVRVTYSDVSNVIHCVVLNGEQV